MIELVGQGRMLAGLEQTTLSVRRSAGVVILMLAPVLASLPSPAVRAQTASGTRSRNQAADAATEESRQVEQTQREEGEAILALADAVMAGKPAPADFAVRWQSDFVKAQRGTFVPFTLTVDVAQLTRRSALVYVRAIRRLAPERRRQDRDEASYPVDAIFPVELTSTAGPVVRISRGFSVAPGEYDVVVVMRERVDPVAPRSRPKAAALRQPLSVPDFRTSDLTTSSVIVADRLNVLAEPVLADQLAERPYVIGRNEIIPAVDRRFRTGRGADCRLSRL